MSAASPALALWAAAALAVVVAVADTLRRRRRARLLRAFGAEPDPARDRMGTALATAAAVAVGGALVGGVGPADPVVPTADGPDVVLLFDVSRSMTVRDVVPDRVGLGRRAALFVATEATSTRMGVAAFAADAHLLLPPTWDRGLVSLYLESLDDAVLAGQGSDLARAVDVAVDAATKGGRRGAVVLVSDGEGFEDGAELDRALDAARKGGVPVHTVRVGTEAGGVVPDLAGSPRSAADPEELARIAAATGGLAVDAADGSGLKRLADGLHAPAAGATPRRAALPPAHWLALAALLALLAEGALDPRRFP